MGGLHKVEIHRCPTYRSTGQDNCRQTGQDNCRRTSFQRADGGALHIRKATRPETELAAIYQALNLDPLPGGVQKTYV